MLKICGDTICKLLKLIFKEALTTDMFPSKWKKNAILYLVTKKSSKQNLENYLSVSLLPVCGKFFERHLDKFSKNLFWLTKS